MKTIEPDMPAMVRGWESEGCAKVELLAVAEGFSIGQVVSVGIRADAKGRKASDFSFHNKQGLRVGGVVLMRKLRHDDGIVTARSIEPIIMRESEGVPFVMQEAAVCVLPPPAGTAMVNECLVAMLGEAIEVRSLSEGVTRILPQLESPAVFGSPGLAYFGVTKTGEPIDVIVGASPDEKLSPQELARRMLVDCPKDIIKESRTTQSPHRPPWSVCPIFRIAVDPDRSSKLSAQAANYSYGMPNDPKWTHGVAVFRTIDNRWHICDASPLEDIQSGAVRLAALNRS